MGKAGAEHGVVGGEWVAGHAWLHPWEGGRCHGVGGGKAGDGGVAGGIVGVDGRLGVHLDGGHGAAVGGGLHLHRPPLAHHHLSVPRKPCEGRWCKFKAIAGSPVSPLGSQRLSMLSPLVATSPLQLQLPGSPLAAAAAACASPGESDFIWTIGILASCVNARETHDFGLGCHWLPAARPGMPLGLDRLLAPRQR